MCPSFCFPDLPFEIKTLVLEKLSVSFVLPLFEIPEFVPLVLERLPREKLTIKIRSELPNANSFHSIDDVSDYDTIYYGTVSYVALNNFCKAYKSSVGCGHLFRSIKVLEICFEELQRPTETASMKDQIRSFWRDFNSWNFIFCFRSFLWSNLAAMKSIEFPFCHLQMLKLISSGKSYAWYPCTRTKQKAELSSASPIFKNYTSFQLSQSSISIELEILKGLGILKKLNSFNNLLWNQSLRLEESIRKLSIKKDMSEIDEPLIAFFESLKNLRFLKSPYLWNLTNLSQLKTLILYDIESNDFGDLKALTSLESVTLQHCCCDSLILPLNSKLQYLEVNESSKISYIHNINKAIEVLKLSSKSPTNLLFDDKTIEVPCFENLETLSIGTETMIGLVSQYHYSCLFHYFPNTSHLTMVSSPENCELLCSFLDDSASSSVTSLSLIQVDFIESELQSLLSLFQNLSFLEIRGSKAQPLPE